MSEVALKKCCIKCGEEFPATADFFYRDKPREGGLSCYCKICVSKARKVAYGRPDVRERTIARVKTYSSRPEVRERRRFYLKDYYSRPDKREHERARNRTKEHARRARLKTVSGIHTSAQIQGLLKCQRHKCYYCAAKFQKKSGKYIYHIDHTFPISRVAGTDIPANDISYIVLACPYCNDSKGDKFPWEFAEGGRLL